MSTNSKIQKQWDAWLRSRDGKECQYGVTFGEQLRERLALAFRAGIKAASKLSDPPQPLERRA